METKTIGYLMPEPTPPPQPLGVVVPVYETTIEQGREFVAEYMGENPRIRDVAAEELDLMAGAFLTLMGTLPITNEELVRWVAEGGCFDPAAIAEYAEKHLGMEPPEKPIEAARGRMAARRGREG